MLSWANGQSERVRVTDEPAGSRSADVAVGLTAVLSGDQTWAVYFRMDTSEALHWKGVASSPENRGSRRPKTHPTVSCQVNEPSRHRLTETPRWGLCAPPSSGGLCSGRTWLPARHDAEGPKPTPGDVLL